STKPNGPTRRKSSVASASSVSTSAAISAATHLAPRSKICCAVLVVIRILLSSGSQDAAARSCACHALALAIHLGRLVPGELAAVDRDRGARDERRPLGAQPQHGVSDLHG